LRHSLAQAASLLILCLGVAAVTWGQSALQPVAPPQIRVQRHLLANGLRVLIVEDHSAPVINLQMWYHVGSKDERSGRTGFAHLFEHLMFKGSAHVPPEEHSRIIEAAGGFDNAYTNDDVTVYWETFPSNYLERAIWLEADRWAASM
jgi:zinc protease